MAETTKKTTRVSKKKTAKKSVPYGQFHILATFNNTIVTFSDQSGAAVAASSAGACGFRGGKKGTAYAAQVAMDKVAQAAKTQHSTKKADVFVKGIGLGRDSAIRAIGSHDIVIESITDVTGIPHGGVRPKESEKGVVNYGTR
jgi:small subunit ribosomal protein S11